MHWKLILNPTLVPMWTIFFAPNLPSPTGRGLSGSCTVLLYTTRHKKTNLTDRQGGAGGTEGGQGRGGGQEYKSVASSQFPVIVAVNVCAVVIFVFVVFPLTSPF